MAFAQGNRYLAVPRFEYCTMLDNAIFDTFVEIFPLNGSIMSINPTLDTFTSLIDSKAREVYERILTNHPDANQAVRNINSNYLDLILT